jgi:hypothetical protein
MEGPRLEITSWAGISIGAQHYNGRLWINGIDYKVEAPISDALLESVSNNPRMHKSLTTMRRIGVRWNSFVTKDDLRDAAREMLRQKLPECKTFVEHDHTIDGVTRRRVLPKRKHEGD